MKAGFTEVRVEMQAGFKEAGAGLTEVRAEMRGGFKEADAKLQAAVKDLRAEMKTEGETTRRHFVVVMEHMRDLVKVVAEGTGRNTERLDDHETRIVVLESPR